MKLKNQAIILNMKLNQGIYEKEIDGYRVQFVTRCHPHLIRHTPCLLFMVDRTIKPEDQQKIKYALTSSKIKLAYQTVNLKDDTLCMHVKINNKTIDLVMYNIFQVIQTFIKADILPANDELLSKYKDELRKYTQEKAFASGS